MFDMHKYTRTRCDEDCEQSERRKRVLVDLWKGWFADGKTGFLGDICGGLMSINPLFRYQM